jgi:hypothetical protein
MLAAMSGQDSAGVSGQDTKTISGMTTCAILNTATVKDSSLLPLLEKAVDDAYRKSVADKVFKDTSAAKTAFSNYMCVVNAAPCDSTGKVLLACYELCVATYMNALWDGGERMDQSDAEQVCKDVDTSAKMGAKCFGTAGANGMKSGDKSGLFLLSL